MPISATNMQALSAFAAVAGEYCAFVDSWRVGRPARLYTTLEGLLPRLYLAILPVEKEMPERKHRKFAKLGMTSEQAHESLKVIAGIVGDETSALFEKHGFTRSDATEVEKEYALRASMLSDDLRDIYGDLHHGLSLWKLDTPDAQAEAAWQWRFGYEIHWGNHLLRAMTTVHEARYQLYAD